MDDNLSATNVSLSSSSSGNGARHRTTHRLNLESIRKDCARGTPTRHKVHDPMNPDQDAMTNASTNGAPEQWLDKQVKGFVRKRSYMEWLEIVLPMTSWLKNYKWRSCFLTDAIAGLTVGVMIVPQSMSYAKLAGLPVEFGLYSSLVPIYAYAVFGSSRQLAVGPVALVSLLLNNGLTLVLERKDMTPDNTDNYDEIYAALAIQVSFLVGICYIIMGILRLGFVTIFLSHAVVSGFTSAAAIIIGFTQVKYIFGYDIPSDKSLHKMIYNIFANIGGFNWKTFVLGTSCVIILLGMKQIAKKYPKLKWARALAPLFVTVLTILLQLIFDLEERGIPSVGNIPKGLPSWSGGVAVDIDDLGQVAVVIISIVIVGFMESIAIAKQLANKNNYEIDASQELLGLGTANLCAGLFSGYPLTGSFSRSAVNNEAGATSAISSIVTATLVLLVLLFLTPVFELLSLPTLASIVISGVVTLVEYEEAIYLWKVHKFDFGVWMFAFVGTLFLGVELGLGIAVSVSLFLVIFESAYPHTAILGRLPGTTEYRNIKNYRQAEMYDGIVIIRVDAPIYFANTQNIREKVAKYEKRETEKLQEKDQGLESVQFIIIEFSAVSHVDTSALHTLHEMHKTYAKNDIKVCYSNPNTSVMLRFLSSGLVDEIGREHIFVSTHDAVDFCLNEMDSDELALRHPTEDNIMQSFLIKKDIPHPLGTESYKPVETAAHSSQATNSEGNEIDV